MEKSKEFLAQPRIGTVCTYEPGLEDGHTIFGKYLVKITKYVQDMPVCVILDILEYPASYINIHEIGKEVFFIVLTNEPNDLLKEII